MVRILLADDDELLRETLRDILVAAGHEVVEADGGWSAVAIFKDLPPDILLLDVVMPDQDGVETIRIVRKLDPTARIIVMSGGGHFDRSYYLDMASKLGASAVLRKPFSSRTLIDLVSRVVAEESESMD